MTKPDIKVQNMRIRYGDFEVIKGIDFSVGAGEFVSIVGKSGCGKSSLLHALAGFIGSAGQVELQSQVGIVFQNYAVFPWLTVQENIAFGLKPSHRDEMAEIVGKHLQMTGLMDKAHKYPSELSGGESQRVALARALAPNPNVILMDEPFGALDQFTREKMQAWLLDIWGENHKTVVFVTHNLEEAIFLSDRVIVLGNGKILGEFLMPFMRPRGEQIKFTEPFVNLKREMMELLEGH